MSWIRRLFRMKSEPLGRRGERVAAKWLRRHGYQILERNRFIADDEADLIALDPDNTTVVIVEVKTRQDEPSPELALTRSKQFYLARLASRLRQSPQYRDRPLRFDAIAVVWPRRGEPLVRHIPGAFESPW